MLAELQDVVAKARSWVTSNDADRMSVEDAARSVGLCAELERLAVAWRTVAGRRVERSHLWSDQGFASPARWMAATAQSTLSSAVATIETGRRLDSLPATRAAVRSGALSAVQAAEITTAAALDPSAERSLLEAAASESVGRLRERCRRVVAAASRDDGVDERIHRSRYLRSWSEPDGAVRVDARLTADMGARLNAVVVARSRVLLEQARRAGSPERREAYAADALISLADGSTSGPRAVVHVHVDQAAWERGALEPGDRCEVAGLGPIPVAAARRLARDGIVKAVLRDDADVRAVAHFRRPIHAKVRTALEARDQICVVPSCDEREGLEIDHVVPLSEGGPTRLDNLARLCRWHHSLKTHRGWQLTGGPGEWRWFKPRRAAVRLE